MASIVSTGIGSGLDIAGIVQSLVAAEGQPVETRIVQKEARAQGKLSAFGTLKSALAELRDALAEMKTPGAFLQRQAASGNEDTFTAVADGVALPSSYAVEVVQLAQAQKLTSGAFVDANTVVGTGALNVALGVAAINIEITAENNTLAGIRDAINAAPDNPGVAATIVNADSGSYLILSGDSAGTGNTITVTQSGGDGGLSALEYDPGNGLTSLTESLAAQDAHIRIDGLDVFGNSNTFAGAVEGVTITAISGSGGAADELLVSNDEEVARELVTKFVESYNTVVTTLDSLTDFNADAELAAPLLGDATVRGIRDQIRRELSTSVEDSNLPFSMLLDIGIEAQLDGTLSVDDAELSSALSSEFVNFGKLFSNDDGFAVRLHELADGYLRSDGVIETRTKGLESRIEDLSVERDSLNERLATLETRLLRQFNALDSLLAQLASTSNFLTQQLSNLPGAERSNGN